MAVVAVRQLQLSDFYDVLPLAAAFALVPTLAASVRQESPPPWPTLPLSHQDLLLNFCFTKRTAAEALDLKGRWWTLFTSALCHSEKSHRDGNMIHLLVVGAQLSSTLGRAGIAFVFFGGHIAALCNSRGTTLQLARYLDATIGNLAPDWVTEGAAKLWTKAAPPPVVLGGSAGTFALLGFDLCVKLDEVRDLLQRCRDSTPAVELLRICVPAASVISMVLAERQSMQAGTSIRVGHAAHLTGFAFGVACFALRCLWRWTRERRPHHASGGFGTGVNGRRLGGGHVALPRRR